MAELHKSRLFAQLENLPERPHSDRNRMGFMWEEPKEF